MQNNRNLSSEPILKDRLSLCTKNEMKQIQRYNSDFEDKKLDIGMCIN